MPNHGYVHPKYQNEKIPSCTLPTSRIFPTPLHEKKNTFLASKTSIIAIPSSCLIVDFMAHSKA